MIERLVLKKFLKLSLNSLDREKEGGMVGRRGWSQCSMILTFKIRQVLPRETLEFNAVLNQHWVALNHQIVVALVESILNVITHVVEASSAYITTGSFELMRSLFHLVPVLLVQAFAHLIHARGQRHNFKPLQHCDKQRPLSA